MTGKYKNGAQQRLMQVMLVLFNNIVSGVTAKQIYTELGCTPASIHRDLANLQIGGWAEQMDSGAWRPTPCIAQQAVKMFNTLQRYEQMIEETRNRFTCNTD